MKYHSEKDQPLHREGFTGICPAYRRGGGGISYRDPNYHIRRINGDHIVFMNCVLAGNRSEGINGTLTRSGRGTAYILHPCTYYHSLIKPTIMIPG